MTSLVNQATPPQSIWALPFISSALGGLLLLPDPRFAYLLGLTVATLAAATLIAIDDFRTGLLRNRWTGPFALAGLIHVLIASTGSRPWITAVAPCLICAAITTSLYLLLGLLGWVGFGDVKFAAGLALFAGVATGWASLNLLPLALTISALSHLFHRNTSKRDRPHLAHGPALATALGVLMSVALIWPN